MAQVGPCYNLRSEAQMSLPEHPKSAETTQHALEADRVLTELLRDSAMTSPGIQKKLVRSFRGYPAKDREKLITARLAALVESGKLYKYPRLGKSRSIKYSLRPAAASDYVGGLRKQLDTLARAVASAGVTRDDLLAAVREAVFDQQTRADDLPQRILEYLKGKPGGISVGRLRQEFGFPIERKGPFDAAVVALYQQHRVFLDRHDFPQGLDEAERNELVTDGSGNYFVVIGLRDADAESVS
jgi:hypothetical protein